MIRFSRGAALAIALPWAVTGCAIAQTSPAESPAGMRALEAVQATEIEFFGRVKQIGVVPAFKEFVGPSAIMFLPEPIDVTQQLDTLRWPGGPEWRLDYGVASSDGSMVATSGPSIWRVEPNAYPGYYFTVWEKQPDQNYRFVLDGSAELAADLYTGRTETADISVVDGSTAADGTIEAAEAALATAANTDVRRAISSRLASNARLLRRGAPPAIGPVEGAERLAAGPAAVQYSHLGGGVAGSGDLGWTYGRVDWSDNGVARKGVFARVWRLEAGNWVIALDHLAEIP